MRKEGRMESSTGYSHGDNEQGIGRDKVLLQDTAGLFMAYIPHRIKDHPDDGHCMGSGMGVFPTGTDRG